MPDSVSITLKGQSIGLSDLSDALVELATVLAEVDQQVTGQRSIDLTPVQMRSRSRPPTWADLHLRSSLGPSG